MKKFLSGLILLLCFKVGYSQSDISGTVTGTGNVPLNGVTVTVKDTKKSVVTNAKGQFKIAAGLNKTLIFTHVGYQTTEFVASTTSILVNLLPTTEQLTEVVVTGYRTLTKRDFTGAVNTVKSDDIKTVPIGSFDQALQGRSPGLLAIANSGQPGAASSVLIRGRGSVLGSTTPLYVMDGIQITANDFASLNPVDFENISVLRDAAATAIYGSRGANGVIVVTSKRGKTGQAKLTYDMQLGYSTLPHNKLELMNTEEKLSYELANGNPYNWTPSEIDSLKKINTNWEKVFFKEGKTKQHALSVSGGSGKTNYFISGSLFDQTGTVQGTKLKRYTARTNVETSSGDFSFGLNGTFGYSEITNTSEDNTALAAPLNAARWLNPYENVYTNGTYTQITSGQPHALQELLENTNLTKQYKGVGNVNISYTAPFLQGLYFRTNFGIDFRLNDISQYADPSTSSGRGQTGGRGALARSNARTTTRTLTSQVGYSTDFGTDHNIAISLFNEIVKVNGRNFGFTGFGLGGPFENEAGITPGTATNGFIPTVSGGGTENALLSYFTDIKYSFKHRYYLNVTARRDGSSRFGANRKWANFGSIGVSWILIDENFMSGLKNKVFNDLKFKASYGSAGNQEGIGSFASRELYGRTFYNGSVGLGQSQLANPDLQWERKTTFNAGLELTILKGRLRSGIDVYNSITDRLFLDKQLSRTTGFTAINENIGELQNRGIEFSVNGDAIRTKNFTWSLNANITYNKNKVLKLLDGKNEIINGTTINRVGETMNSWYLVRSAGVDATDGNPLFIDNKNAVGQTWSPDYRVIRGSLEVPFFGGFGTTLNFKGLEADVFFTFVSGNKIFNNDRRNVEYPTYLGDNLAKSMLREWRTPGQVTDRPGANANYDNFHNSDAYLEDASYVRLRNIMVSYTLPSTLISKIRMKNLRVFAQGQNLVTWHNTQTYDPEISVGVLSGAQFPALRTITFGLTAGF